MTELEELQDEIEDLEHEIANLYDEINEKDAQILDLEQDVYRLQNELEDAEIDADELDQLRETVSCLEGNEEEHENFVETIGSALGIHKTSKFHVDPLNTILEEIYKLKGE